MHCVYTAERQLARQSKRILQCHFHTQTLPPPPGADLLHNPMGIYVTSYALAETASLAPKGG